MYHHPRTDIGSVTLAIPLACDRRQSDEISTTTEHDQSHIINMLGSIYYKHQAYSEHRKHKQPFQLCSMRNIVDRVRRCQKHFFDARGISQNKTSIIFQECKANVNL